MTGDRAADYTRRYWPGCYMLRTQTMKNSDGLSIRLAVALVVLGLGATTVLAAACGGGVQEVKQAAPAAVPTPRAGAQLGPGAGPTPIPVTPTPTPTPSPERLTLYENTWKGFYEEQGIKRNIVITFEAPKITPDRAIERASRGKIDVKGIVMDLTRVVVEGDTINFIVRFMENAHFTGELQDKSIKGTIDWGGGVRKGTFEVDAE